VACVQGRINPRDVISDLGAHDLGVRLMSAAYESWVLRSQDLRAPATVMVEWTEV
jgi:hypothetical protein